MRTRPFITFAAVVVVVGALLVAACGRGDDAAGNRPLPTTTTDTTEPSVPTTPPTSLAEAISGRTFITSEAHGFDLVPGTVVRIGFDLDGDVGTLGAQAGCNSMGGGWSIDDDRLAVGEMFSTEMGCDPARMEQDAWLISFLTGRPTAALDGDTLSLVLGDQRLELVDRRVADPDQPLTDTRWEVDTIVSAGAASSTPIGVTASLVFSDGHVLVEAGCNTGSAMTTVNEADGTITLGPLALTKMACDPPAMQMEAAVTAIFDAAVGYEITAGRLWLQRSDGTAGLGLVAVP